MKKLVMYAAGTLAPKKESQIQSVYLNYGVLGLATLIKERTDYEVIVYQGDNKSIAEIILESAESLRALDARTPIFISMPSFLALGWVEALVVYLKQQYQNPIVLGGRWVLDNNPLWIKEKLPLVDFFSFGTPDNNVEELVHPENWPTYTVSSYQQPFARLDYTLLHNYQHYQPVVEVQRGCGMGCSFCLESAFSATPLKSVQAIQQEVKEILSVYGTEQLNIYFEASFFNPSKQWAEEFAQMYVGEQFKFHWRMTTRVDVIQPEVLKILAVTNLKAVDLGLESASKRQLLKMNKTKHPVRYLKQARAVIKACSDAGIWVKLNILLYLNETETTLAETYCWLKENQQYIKGLSINPLTVYLNGKKSTLDYVSWIEHETNRRVDVEALMEKGYVHVDLSEKITKEDAKQIARNWANELMPFGDFEDLKRISYTYRSEV